MNHTDTREEHSKQREEQMQTYLCCLRGQCGWREMDQGKSSATCDLRGRREAKSHGAL